MKVSELTLGDSWEHKAVRELDGALDREGKNISVSYCDYADDEETKPIFLIVIKDWRVKRRWKLRIDDGVGYLSYAKRTIRSSADLNEIADALYEDEKKLSAAYTKRTLKQSASSGDLRPWVIDELRKVLEPKTKVGGTTEMVSLSARSGSVRLFVGFTDTTLNLTISSPVGSDVIKIDMASPSFFPAELGNKIIECIVHTKELVTASKNNFKSIWKTTNG